MTAINWNPQHTNSQEQSAWGTATSWVIKPNQQLRNVHTHLFITSGLHLKRFGGIKLWRWSESMIYPKRQGKRERESERALYWVLRCTSVLCSLSGVHVNTCCWYSPCFTENTTTTTSCFTCGVGKTAQLVFFTHSLLQAKIAFLPISFNPLGPRLIPSLPRLSARLSSLAPFHPLLQGGFASPLSPPTIRRADSLSTILAYIWSRLTAWGLVSISTTGHPIQLSYQPNSIQRHKQTATQTDTMYRYSISHRPNEATHTHTHWRPNMPPFNIQTYKHTNSMMRGWCYQHSCHLTV